MKVSDIFDVKYGVNLELINCEFADKNDDYINFVSRTAKNNGVSGRVKRIEGCKPHPAGTLSCAGGGSVLSTFLQSKPYYSGRDLFILTPRYEMSDEEMLFWCKAINYNAYKYNYGRQANKTLGDIKIPEDVPEWVGTIKAKSIETKIEKKENNLDVNEWNWFDLVGENGIFEIENCKCSNATALLVDGNDIEYIGAKKKRAGVMNKVEYNDELVTKGNCVIFICDGQGSVGYTNYIDHDFIGSTTLSVGRNVNINKYIGLFLVSILDMERYKYSFGRKYRNSFSKAKIKLPSLKNDDGVLVPDWIFMERYIKSLPYSDLI